MGSSFSLPLGRLFGVPLRLHPLLFVWLCWTFLDAIFDPNPSRWTVPSLVLVALLSVLLHEWAHALVARRFGRVLGPVVLGPVSVSWVSSKDAPAEDAWIAASGPAVNLVLAAGAALFSLAEPGPAVAALLRAALWTNLALGGLNLLPIHPMDGGKILHAVLCRTTDPRRAWRRTLWTGVLVGGIGALGLAIALPAPWSFLGVLLALGTSLGPVRSLRKLSRCPRDDNG